MKRQDRETRWDETYDAKERIYQWMLKRGSNYDPDRGLERRPGRSDD
jgi:hydrogenase small subunit